MRSQTQDQRGTRRISGVVNADGTVYLGVGFTSLKTGPGAYTVRFAEPFKGMPTAVATCNASNQAIAVLSAVLAGSFNAATLLSSTGAAADAAFEFQVEGLAR